MTRRTLGFTTAIALVIALVGGVVLVLGNGAFGSTTITAYFTRAAAIYPGDEVRIAGVRVGTIDAIDAEDERVRFTLKLDSGVPVPVDARAVIVPQNLISARYVQLAPAYIDSGPTMTDGGVIPVERTAVPVEWDQVKDQLMRLASDLGPDGDGTTSAMGRLIDSAAGAMDGNGTKLRDLMSQLAGAARIFADGGGDIVDVIRHLQELVGALRDSNTQIVEFQNRFASLTEVVNGSRTDLDAALTDIAAAVGDVQRFVSGSRNQTSEQIQRLANVTQVLVDHRVDLENLLHGAPTAFANFYNMYNPDSGTVNGSFAFQNFANPVQFICSAIGSVENATAPETAKLCGQYLGPALSSIDFNYLPIPFNPLLGPSASPEHILYSPTSLDPALGGPPPGPPDIPPAVSAYTGLYGDVAPPPGYGPPPGPAPGGVDDLLLPAEGGPVP